MAQKIKVQDGIIVYSSADPVQPVDVTVLGNINVTQELMVGSNITGPASALITTVPGTVFTQSILEITTGAYGTINLHQNATGGVLTINGAKWPNSASQPTPGMFLGSSAASTLEYYPFILGMTSSDILTDSELNALYPTAQPGQSAVGPVVVYYAVAPGQWRRLGGAGPGPGPTPVSTVNAITYTSTTTAVDQVIDSVSMSLYRAATYRIAVVSGADTQYTEVYILHDGTNAYIDEIGTITSGPLLATFTADISGGNMRLLSTPVNASTLYTSVSVLISAAPPPVVPVSTVNAISYTSTTTTVDQVIDSVAISAYRAATYCIATVSGTDVQYTEVYIVHDGTNVQITEIGTITSGPNLATYTADISGGNMRLLSTPVNASTLYTSVSVLISAAPPPVVPVSTVNAISYTSTTTAVDQVINSVAISAYRAATYRVAVYSGVNNHYTELCVLHDGTNVYIDEISTTTSGPLLATFTADISGGNMRLLSTPINASTLYTAVSILVAA